MAGNMNDAVRVRDMPWPELKKLLRVLGPEIGRLAKRGDKFAKSVYRRYQHAYAHPNDTHAHMEMRIAVDDYLSRDLRLSERTELGSRYGHLIDEPEHGTRIVVPGTLKPQ